MDFLGGLFTYIVPFLVVLTAVVYVHELGHYWVARWGGVKIDTFSIGFGPELFHWYNRQGTRWRIAAIPLGGYVKFHGDADASSAAVPDMSHMDAAERAVSYHAKPVAVRAAIAAAGPVANFLFAIAIFAVVFTIFGQPYTAPVIGGVATGSAAEQAGLKAGDRIVAVDGRDIVRFEDLRTYVALRAETPIAMAIERDHQPLTLTVTPRRVDVPDGFGGTTRVGQVGIQSGGVMEFKPLGPGGAVVQGVREVWAIVGTTFTYVGRVFSGHESGDQISGPIGIAKMSGDVARLNPFALITLIATLSVGIGLVNLFPVPMLDGGHLLFYAIEAVRGRPLGDRAQEFGFRVGLALVFGLFLFATWNDLQRLQVFGFLAKLFS